MPYAGKIQMLRNDIIRLEPLMVASAPVLRKILEIEWVVSSVVLLLLSLLFMFRVDLRRGKINSDDVKAFASFLYFYRLMLSCMCNLSLTVFTLFYTNLYSL